MTDFIWRYTRPATHKASKQAERLMVLSTRDSLRLLAALEDPPPPNAKLLSAACRLPAGGWRAR